MSDEARPIHCHGGGPRDPTGLMTNHPHERLLRLPEVMARTGLGRSAIYDRIKAGAFPRQIKLGPRTSTWDERSIDAWIRAQRDRQDATREAEAGGDG